jgi:PAS domain S-box-containing protein
VSDQVLRTLIAHLPGAAYRCANDADWTFEFLSEGILGLTGYPAKDFIGKSITSYDRVIHPDDRAMVRQAAQAAAERFEPFQVTYRIVTASGQVRWVWEQGVGVVEDAKPVALEGFITDVTDRVTAEHELQEAKHRLEQLIGSMTEGLTELDADGAHIDVNAAFSAMTGFSRDELIGVGPPHPYWPPEEIAAIGETFARSQAGESSNFELIFMRKNGERFPVVVSPFVIHDDHGAIVALSATFRDISGQRAAEEAARERARESEQLVAAGLALIACHTKDEVFDVLGERLAEMLPDVVTLVNRCSGDPSGIVVHSVTGMDSSALTRAASLVGFDIVGKTAVVAEKDLGRTFVRSLQRFDGGFEGYVAGYAPKPVAKLAKRAFGFHDVYIIGISDGISVFGNISILTREPGTVLPARAVESFVQQAFLTLARIRASRERAESEAKYRALTESMADVVWTLDPETLYFTYVSPSVLRLRGLTPEEVMAEPLDAALPPEGSLYVRKLMSGRLVDRLASRIDDDTFFTEEVEQPRKDGSLVWTEVVTCYSLNQRTGRVEVRGVTRDISERKAAEAELAAYRQGLETLVEERTQKLAAANEDLRRVNEQLREATAAKSAFLASMSHELRTPLNSIIGFSGILLQGLAGPLEYEQRTQVEMVNRSGRHLLSLIDDVLDLAKVESGSIALAAEHIDAAALVRDVADVVRPLATDKGLYLELDGAVSDCSLDSDPGKLRQILFNLVGNAVKFTERGGVRIGVRHDPEGTCSFWVSDSGQGIAAEDLARIFEPFTQLESLSVAKPKGTGLGLRISLEYAHLLGGEITVVSEPGEGSTFTLTLPPEPPSKASAD